ncbi:Holliday junction branch migration protein RuvA [Candidatus Falkowbacteria bacterium]|jgi:holliday junction DNA helicase RuvA|nr:Holliday junction branch migration protein RuvA [Candidatus Falkowbacteria bacterium]MBT4432778.1 Holliday junction branch migration protein RuvA [Candidatus Falkowbacteria bacterium]
MISYLKGKIISIDNLSVILLASDTGYKIFLGNNLLSQIKLGEEKEFFTFLRFREDALSLFGFQNKEELDLFNQLISVSGVGPKSALHLLDTVGLGETQRAIVNKRADVLSRAPGLGKKTAEKIIIELKNKIIVTGDDSAPTRKYSEENEDVVNALVGLGYTARDAREALESVSEEIEGTDNKIKEALRVIGR